VTRPASQALKASAIGVSDRVQPNSTRNLLTAAGDLVVVAGHERLAFLGYP
jgi:hypothetical protein